MVEVNNLKEEEEEEHEDLEDSDQGFREPGRNLHGEIPTQWEAN